MVKILATVKAKKRKRLNARLVKWEMPAEPYIYAVFDGLGPASFPIGADFDQSSDAIGQNRLQWEIYDAAWGSHPARVTERYRFSGLLALVRQRC